MTKGKPEVTDVVASDNFQESYILQLAASAEIKSEHPIAQAIVNKATERNMGSIELSEFAAVSGRGVVATYREKEIFIGSPRCAKCIISDSIMQSSISELESQGKTVVAVFIEDKLAGIIAVGDTLRENARRVIDEIKQDGKKVMLVSGDSERTAKAIAQKLGMDIVLSQVLPETKVQEIKKLQDEGRIVAMVGDGINDAPGLTQADVGIAMGSGTDVAMAAGHVILMKSNLQGVITALKIGTFSLKKIKQNLAISFAYNAITMSIAAGIFYSITNSLILTPSLAALGWNH